MSRLCSVCPFCGGRVRGGYCHAECDGEYVLEHPYQVKLWEQYPGDWRCIIRRADQPIAASEHCHSRDLAWWVARNAVRRMRRDGTLPVARAVWRPYRDC